jgi:phosphoserine phosphatase RsbU/P
MNDSNTIINLESLIDFSARLNETSDQSFILNSVLLSLMGKLRILRACVVIPDGDKFKPELCKGKIKISHKPTDDEEVPVFQSYDVAKEFMIDNGFRHFLPVIYRQDTLALICLGPKVNNDGITKEEEHYLSLICAITANAIKNAHSHQSLIQEKNITETRNQLLTTLFEISRNFHTILSREQILKMLSYQLMGQLMVNRFAVFSFSEDKGFELIINRFPEEPSKEIFSNLSKIKEICLIEESSIPLVIFEFMKNVKASVISPMAVQGKIKGMLIIGNKMNGNFTEEDKQFIEALGNTAISALETERLFKEEVEKKKLEKELELALEIQKNLLPKEIPVLENYQLTGVSIPSSHVGGDYFDFIKLDEDRLLIAIADVSGKGMPASLLMANVQAALRILAPLSLPLKEIILRINDIIYQNTTPDKFVTFFGGILYTKTGIFHYINAGHNPPLLFRTNEEIIKLKEGGLILGFMDKPFEYLEGEIELSYKDVLIFFTDGVTEALDKEKNEYTEQKFIEFSKGICGKPASNILEDILEDVRKHSEGVNQSDDITCIVLKSEKS